MKNIHLLPTECFNEMSHQIWRKKDGSLWKPTKEFPINSNLNGKVNIYITSDEEIKEGDWCFDIFLDAVFQANWFMGIKTKNTARKIILTTDPDLISDGVQAIDDEFLEWFVKNPNYEWVSIESYKIDKEWDETHTHLNPVYPMKTKYKIIIPREEPKQTDEKGNPMTYWGGLKESKQETFEEAAERVAKLKYGATIYGLERVNAFKEGASWQGERMYSNLSKARNELYDALPVGDIDAFELLKLVQIHLQKLDDLCGNK
jgi:hypothetical protein